MRSRWAPSIVADARSDLIAAFLADPVEAWRRSRGIFGPVLFRGARPARDGQGLLASAIAARCEASPALATPEALRDDLLRAGLAAVDVEEAFRANPSVPAAIERVASAVAVLLTALPPPEAVGAVVRALLEEPSTLSEHHERDAA